MAEAERDSSAFLSRYSLKSVLDVGVPHGVEDGPRTPPRWGRSGKSFK